MSCHHSKDEKSTAEIVQKHVNIIHKISTKMTTMIKASGEHLSHTNFNPILIQVMRDLNKHKLNGFEKRDIAIMIMQLLLDWVGLPHIVSEYTAEIIVTMIEHVYHAGLHKYKRPHKWRFWK